MFSKLRVNLSQVSRNFTLNFGSRNWPLAPDADLYSIAFSLTQNQRHSAWPKLLRDLALRQPTPPTRATDLWPGFTKIQINVISQPGAETSRTRPASFRA